MIKRKAYDKLLSWKNGSNGHTAILIDGARRVGKSYLAEKFAQEQYKSYILIDFGNPDPQILDLFNNDTHDLDIFFQKLSIFAGVKLYDRESIIVFDEVQQCPRARQLIKYLVADGRYDYLETGSLISLKKNIQDIVIPSEEEHISLFPLDFEEFLWALDDELSYPYILECYENLKPLGQAIHAKVMNKFRQYILVGGMPQSVLAYQESKSFEESDFAKRNILNLYRSDVSKFAPGYEDKVISVFDQIPSQLSKPNKKYKITSIDDNARFRSYDESFIWLSEAMIVNRCLNATDPNVGLALSAEHSTQKCYMSDTGLLVTQTFSDSGFTDNELYRAILFDKLNVNEGMIFENVVSQMLRAAGHKLYFYAKNDREERSNNMEVDFVISRNKKLCPIEVKSGDYRSHKSLSKFIDKFSRRIDEPYILYTKDVMKKDGITYLPAYMAGLL